MTPRWDIFCKVVDNYGDIGVAWRLARTLAAHHGLNVSIWVDDLAALSRIWPGVSSTADRQQVGGIDVRRWCEPFPTADPGDVVIETFQCTPPQSYMVAMAARTPAPRWINLDYLSAESWVGSCHRLPSPHPRLPLTKYFYFPGFDAATGGLLHEPGLESARASFLADARGMQDFWRSHGLAPPREGELRVSLFCYPTAPVAALVEAWSRSATPITVLMPEGPAALEFRALMPATQMNGWIERGASRIKIIPFTDQDAYDRLLWACDLNFVRGEDSFLRAHWARRAFVWNIYPQQENAHWIKLHAFLDRYVDGLGDPAPEALRQLWRVWNGIARASEVADAWCQFNAHRAAIERHTALWAEGLAARKDLTSGLVEFCADIGQLTVT